MEAVVSGWTACSLCGARVEMKRVPEYTVEVYPKQVKTQAHVKRNI